MTKITLEQAGWLYAADLAEQSLERSRNSDPPLYSDKDRNTIESFVRFVREHKGMAVEEAYEWKEMINMFVRA